jgi:hypothetical protein
MDRKKTVRALPQQDLDSPLILALLGSFVAHFGFVAYLRTIDRPRERDPEEIAWPFTSLALPRPKAPAPPAVAPRPAGGPVATPRPRPAPVPAPGPGEGERPRPAPPATRPAPVNLAEQVARMGMMAVLGSRGPAGELQDRVGSGDEDADRAFAGLGGVGVPKAGAAPGAPLGGGGSGEARRLGGLLAAGPAGDVRTGDKGEAPVRPVVTNEPPTSLGPDVDPAGVVSRLRQYRGALIACYESALKRDRTLSGRMVLRVSLTRAGLVGRATIEGDTVGDEELRRCVVERAQGWRFPPLLASQEGGPEEGMEFACPLIFTPGK